MLRNVVSWCLDSQCHKLCYVSLLCTFLQLDSWCYLLTGNEKLPCPTDPRRLQEPPDLVLLFSFRESQPRMGPIGRRVWCRTLWSGLCLWSQYSVCLASLCKLGWG
jgi:hypothetical protein